MSFDDIAPIEDCPNPYSFGEICVCCNQCGRFGEDVKKVTNDEVQGLQSIASD